VHLAAGGKQESWWKVLGWAVATAILLVVAVVVLMVMDIPI
jgi:hypothetical protein